MTLEEKYPSVFKRLEVWSDKYKPVLKERSEKGLFSYYEYLLVMNKLCLRTKEEVEAWLKSESPGRRRTMTMEEKYPNVFKGLELWSAEWKALFKDRFDRGVLAPYEYIVIMTKLCLETKEKVEAWLNED